MKSDIEIAQEAKMIHIKEVAAKLDIQEDDLELYGKYKAKLSDELMDRVKDNPDGKLILVTAINPTPAGEGKTTTSVGLGQAFGKLGKKAEFEADVKAFTNWFAKRMYHPAFNVINSGHVTGSTELTFETAKKDVDMMTAQAIDDTWFDYIVGLSGDATVVSIFLYCDWAVIW